MDYVVLIAIDTRTNGIMVFHLQNDLQLKFAFADTHQGGIHIVEQSATS